MIAVDGIDGLIIAATPFFDLPCIAVTLLASFLHRLGEDQIAPPPREAALLGRWQGFSALSHAAFIGT